MKARSTSRTVYVYGPAGVERSFTCLGVHEAERLRDAINDGTYRERVKVSETDTGTPCCVDCGDGSETTMLVELGERCSRCGGGLIRVTS